MTMTFMKTIKSGLVVALLAALTGCVGWVDGRGHYGGAVIVPVPGVYYFGGGYESGHDAHEFSRRGYESRGR